MDNDEQRDAAEETFNRRLLHESEQYFASPDATPEQIRAAEVAAATDDVLDAVEVATSTLDESQADDVKARILRHYYADPTIRALAFDVSHPVGTVES